MKRGLLGLVLLFPGSPGSAQKAMVPSEKCTIEGSVVKSLTGEPLKKTWVVLSKAEGREFPLSTFTDSSGHFVLKDINPGQYRLWVERSGYVSREYGEAKHSATGAILTLEPGQQLRDIVFRLIPTGAISGRVFDEDNETVAGVHVQALRDGFLGGKRRLVLAGTAVTNDLGEYRLYGLPPGHYYLSAIYTPRPTTFGLAATTPGGDTPGSVAEESYAPSYYPGTNSPARASPVDLGAGENVGGFDFTLLPVRTVALRGRVTDALTGQPGRGTRIGLVPPDSRARGLLFHSEVVAEDIQGAFEIRGVPPGSYTLSATRLEEGKVYFARQDLEVPSAGVRSINLELAPTLEVQGRVRVEGNGQVKLTDLRVLLQPQDDTVTEGTAASVNAHGTFTLKDVADETYSLFVVGAPENFYLKAARLGSDDVVDGAFRVRGGRGPGSLELVLSSAGGHIQGIVLNEQRGFSSGASVVLIPESPRRSQARLYKTTTTDQYGQFRLQGISPGEYKLFAWEDVEPGTYQDPDFLTRYEKRGEYVSVEEAGRYSFELRLIPADERRQ